MELKKILKKLSLVFLIPAGVLLIYLSSFSPKLVERIYSSVIYRIITTPLNLLSGMLPFSLGEFLLIGFIVLVIIKLVRLIVRLIKTPSKVRQLIPCSFINLLVFVSALYFSFVIIWGINYQRLPFSQIAGLDVQPASVNELYAVCEDLLRQVNELRQSMDENKDGVMVLFSSKENALKRAFEGYENAAVIYPELGGIYARPKGVIFSEIMSYLGIGGMYSPYTGEANVNTSLPDASFPFTTCHEMAHQRGFSREDEANYIAYFTCTLHPDKDFQYSGVLSALTYSANALYKSDPESYTKLAKSYSEGVKRDLKAINKYWRKYDTPVQEFSSSVNDTYLKAQMQEDGVKSYGRMVDLLIAEYRKKVKTGL